MSAWTAAALFVGAPPWGGLAVGLVLLLIGCVVRLRRRSITLGLLAAGVAAVLAALRVVQVGAGPVPDLAAQEAVVAVTVVITGDPRTSSAGPVDTDVVEASVRNVVGRGVRTDVRTPVLLLAAAGVLSEVELGSQLELIGRLLPADGRDLAAVVRVERMLDGETDPAWWWTGAEGVRSGVRGAIDWAGAPGALVPALVTGDDRALPPDVVDDFATSGLTHLLAVSGTNLTLVLGAVLAAARAAGARGRLLTVVGILGAVGFVLVARPDPSVLRAAAMGLVALVGLTAGDRRRGLRALCVAVLMLVLLDPWLARSVGFLLSVLATAAILLFGAPWRDALARWMPRWLAEAIAVPLAAQLVCTPVVAALSGQVSLVAVAANVLAAPAVGPATVLGLLAGLVSLGWPAGADLVGAAAVLPAWWIVAVARQCAQLPGADIGWAVSPLSLLGLGILCAAAVGCARWVLRLRVASIGVTLVLIVVVVQPLPSVGWPPDDWVFVACDVGQGDGLVLSAGSGTAVVVDTGPDPAAMRGCLERLDVRAVSAVVLTHLHADHVGGLAGVLGVVPVGEVQVGPGRSPAESWQEVQELAAAEGVPLRTVAAGEQLRVGTLSWTVVAPLATPGADLLDDGADINNVSLVLMVDAAGVRILLTGDVETQAQMSLAALGLNLDVDVLKVPHHGSASQDPAFLAATDPALAVVSVGSGNDYGHPSAVVVDMVRRAGAEVLRTDLDGDIAVVSTEGGLAVATG